MKDVADFKTLDIILPAAAPRRGRGRPRVDNPLTAAERMKRSRIKKRQLLDDAADNPAAASNLVLIQSLVNTVKFGCSPDRQLSELCRRFPAYIDFL